MAGTITSSKRMDIEVSVSSILIEHSFALLLSCLDLIVFFMPTYPPSATKHVLNKEALNNYHNFLSNPLREWSYSEQRKDFLCIFSLKVIRSKRGVYHSLSCYDGETTRGRLHVWMLLRSVARIEASIIDVYPYSSACLLGIWGDPNWGTVQTWFRNIVHLDKFCFVSE